jgi:membrane protein implicated in regulation of membrane protease activity
MENIDKNYLLAILGVVAIIVEVLMGAPTGFDLFLLGIIFLLGAGMGALTGSFVWTLVTIIVLSFVYVLVGRNLVKSKLKAIGMKTSTENLIGRKAMVVKPIKKDKPGQVKVEGEIWRAQANAHIEEGKEVTIKSISGVTVTVE